jgi:nucleotide-binding universal stress UspA family protein
MFKHILVPLDGSNLAESALPAAVYMATMFSASVTLIHVIERNPPEEIHGNRHLSNPDEANAYLADVAQRSFPREVRTEWHVHTAEVSDVARSIAEHAGELSPDLIVMCTHGKSGVRGWIMGSIAQQVIALGKTPILLMQPGEDGGQAGFTCRQLLVPLDGKPDHEQSVPVAAEIARTCGASIHLLSVVPTLGTLSGESAATARLLPGATSAVLEMAEQTASQYLAGFLRQLLAQNLTVTSEISRGDPAPTIVKTAETIQADLIVLGTHGKSGAGAFWAGSVGPKIASLSHRPMLLVPVHP